MARGFSFDELTRHALILGKPGQGKTNLLLSLLLELGDPALQAKHPSAQIFIDPHGDASFKLARTMKDWSKLLLLDPTEIQLSINPLELLPYEGEDERIFQIQVTVSELLMILEDILKTDLERASRMSWIFTGGLYFLYHFNNSPTFIDLYNLMIDFQTLSREEVQAMLKNASVPDELLEKTMEAISRLEKAAYSPVLNRLARFIIPSGSYSSRTFCCRKTNVPWELMLEPGRTTIISVSKSDLPGEFRELLTNSLVMKFYFLIQQRARKLKKEGRFGEEARTPIFLVIDEFQTIERLAILETILSEARKFGLSLVLAHQNIAQLRRPELRESLLANVGLLCALTVGPDDAALLSKIFGAEFRDRLLDLEQGKMVVRRQPPGEVAWTEVMQIDRVPDPARTPEEVVRFMQTEMKVICPPVPEDREPIYRKALEELRKDEGLPWVGVTKSLVAWHLHYLASQSLNTYSYMVKEFAAHQGWDSTHVHNALNWLEARGYIIERVILGKAYRGKDPAGSVIWAEPETQDELERARTFQYYLTAKGEQAFFGRPTRWTQRAGGPLHLRVLDHYLNDYSRKRGFFPVADYGENRGKFPDVIIYPPIITHDEKRNKEVWDPETWNKKERIAVEIETNPSKHAKQLVENYEKSVGKYARLVFAIVDEKHREDVRRILAAKDPGTYEIERPVLGLSVDELREETKEEEKIADEEPTTGSEQAAAGTSAVTAPPTSAAGSGPQQQRAPDGFAEDDSKRRPTRGFYTLPQLMNWHKEEFGEHQLFTGNCPCGLADAEISRPPTTLMPVDQLLPWAVRYYNRDGKKMVVVPLVGPAPPSKPAEQEQGRQEGQEKKAPDNGQGEVTAKNGEKVPQQSPSVMGETTVKPEAANGPPSGQPPEPPEPPAGMDASGDRLNEEESKGGSGGKDGGGTGGGGKKNAARFHQLMILRIIEARGPQMRSDLLKELDARPRSVTRYVHDLIAGGYITEAAKKYYLAERGRQHLEKLHQELGIKE